MYLKSIEVQGFKSFANKIVFEFHNGITGIVGPNGSGKSNVADAVRWVLGEQSVKQLRGAKMEDVIFSGTENRKALGFAYVALTIDNSDHQLAVAYDTVTVSRRVYRSGESEYQINGNACRLREINELFYDTGIGKEGYSIIGQGQIERILSGKPEERRELFDEAAGIVKFKRRKAEALRKLDAEKQNLTRVEDILSELEKQVGPLERQAETAKEYLRLKEELKLQDINAFLLESRHLKEQIAELEEKCKTAEHDLKGVKKEQEQGKIQYEKLEEQLRKKQESSEALKTEITKIQMESEKAESEIRLLEEQIHSIQQQDENTTLRIQQIEQTLKEQWQEEDRYTKEQIAVDQTLSEVKERQKQVQAEREQLLEQIERGSKAETDNRNHIITLLNEKAVVKTKVQRYETMLEQIQLRKAELSGRILQFKSQEAAEEESIAACEKRLNQISDTIKKLEESQASLQQQAEEEQKQRLEWEEQKNRLQQEFHRIHSKLESLRNLTERYEGYGSSIRKVMEQKKSQHGIIGVVADIIQTEKRYETAIEIALGGSIQNIVTDKEQTAKELIEYLKKNRYGRATFLPLDGMGKIQTFSNQAVFQEPGVIGLASDLAEADAAYQKVVTHLLGRVLVVDQMEHALALARKFQHTLRIVTLEGELLSAGGSITGGTFKNSSSLLSRRREIEELEKKEAGIGQDLERIQKSIREGLEKDGENQEIQKQNQQMLQENYIIQNTEEIQLTRARQEKAAKTEKYQSYIKEGKAIEQQILEIQKNLQQLNQQLICQEQENQQLETAIRQIIKETEVLRKEESEKGHLLEEIHMEYSSGCQKTAFAAENKKRIQKEIQKLTEEQAALADHTEQAVQKIQGKELQIEKIKQQILEADRQLEAQKKTVEAVNLEKERLIEQQKKGLQAREELTDQIVRLEKEHFRLLNQKEKLEESLLNSVNYIWNEYELTQTEAITFLKETKMGLLERKKQIASLKTQIRNLGVVNVNAIEDFKEVSERYLFLKGQHQDLTEAEDTLIRIIEELDRGMREQFLEKFQEIQIEFNQVFQELFGGGTGTLSLVEEEDILEAGIRIISQPPGKKLQNMMQLSGGEKALTAIALLFAIQNLKPSPFCLLDEIEAALDDSNVGRYAEYLHKLTASTQFIVITHRKGTMAAADRLYGITMQEKGVSTLVSVDLTYQGSPPLLSHEGESGGLGGVSLI